MKQAVVFVLLLALFASCNQPKKANQSVEKKLPDTLRPVEKPNEQDAVKAKGAAVLSALRAKNYKLVSQFFSKNGVYFSPYGFLDSTNCKRLTSADFLESIQKNWILTWGSYDGSGEPIQLTTKAFIKKFVYNADYLHAEQVSYNQVFQKGNSLVNLTDIFPNHPFLDYHFSGFDQKYAGMDWTSLILVFDKEGSDYVLVAVIHHQWTV